MACQFEYSQNSHHPENLHNPSDVLKLIAVLFGVCEYERNKEGQNREQIDYVKDAFLEPVRKFLVCWQFKRLNIYIASRCTATRRLHHPRAAQFSISRRNESKFLTFEKLPFLRRRYETQQILQREPRYADGFDQCQLHIVAGHMIANLLL